MKDLKATIDLDIGGTFTDALVCWKGSTVTAKTPTTGYNLAIGFLRVVKDAAKTFGVDLPELLQATKIIRYSTTVAMNKLIERKGPRLGLITTLGFEDTIFVGKGAQWADGLAVRERRNVARAERPQPLIPREMTVGVRERVDSQGRIICPLDEKDVVDRIHYLVDRGVRGFVISLLWSYLNPAHERAIREIIRSRYPDSYLGCMPVILSSEVLPKRHEYSRTLTAILNAYLHQAMWEELMGTSEEMRRNGYTRPLMMVHNSGGMAEVYKTSAVQTYNGGPVAGLLGAAFLGKQTGMQDLIVADMGGTSFDIGLVVGGSPKAYQSQPLIDCWQVGITMLETRSIGAGGGSIASINDAAGRQVEVGPRSAGSMPGPAAYDQGGREPTVTDADVVLGYLNPEYFHGGRLPLNPKKARSACQEKIADPLGLSVEEGALLIRRLIDAKMGHILFKETALRGHDPRNFTLIACGGAGPTHCCGFGEYAKVSRIVTFSFSPVFCAFGSANMDIQHVYEQSRRIQLLEPGGRKWLQDYEVFNNTVDEIEKHALRDIQGEGLSKEEKVFFELELDLKFGGQLNIKRSLSPRLRLHDQEDVKAIYDAFADDYARAYSSFSLFPGGGVEIHNFLLRAILKQTRMELPRYPLQTESPPPEARKKSRAVYWEEYADRKDTPIFEEKKLQPGNRIKGPAILEAPSTTTVLPPGWLYFMNEFRAGIIQKEG